METFGRKLQQAVEANGLNLEDVARVTGLDIAHLRALARDDLAAVPADDSITDGLEAFARLVGVEPDEVIADYERERTVEETLAPTEPAVSIVPEIPPLPAEEAHAPASRPAGSAGRIAVVATVLALTAAGIFWLRSSAPRDGVPDEPTSTVESTGGFAATGAPTPSVAAESGPVVTESEGSSTSAATAESVTAVTKTEDTPIPSAATDSIPVATQAGDTSVASRVPEAISVAPRPESTPAPGRLAIPQFGVGTGVVNRALVGAGETFAEGTRVWFWTWVEGATAGDVIRHVWIHEGQEMLSTPLNLGGARWRTHSYKNLHAGSTGEWVVEARDSAGRVLARQPFQCFKPSSS